MRTLAPTIPRARLLVGVVLACALATGFSGVAHAYPGGPPDGYTGGGGQPNCTACHSGSGAVNSHAGTRVMIGGTRSSYCPSRSYNLTVYVTGLRDASIYAGQRVAGFELGARNGANTASRGTLSAVDTSLAQVSAGQYAMQTMTGRLFSSSTTMASWNLTWVAPAAGGGTVNFYAAGNDANGDNTCFSSDDWISTAAVSSVENSAPAVPSLASPGDGAVVSSATPSLSASEVIDTNAGDPVTYEIQLCDDAACSSTGEVLSPALTAAGGFASWTPSELPENQKRWWRARANDGCATTAYSSIRSFTVDAVPEAPSAVVFANPLTGGTVSITPTFTVGNATDPDPFDTLTYEFTVATDAAFAHVVTFATNVSPGGAGQTSWTPAVPLPNHASLYLLAQARDATGQRGAPAIVQFATFSNTAPGVPAPSSPANGAVVGSATPTLAALLAADDDGNPLQYQFEVCATQSCGTALQTSPVLATAPTDTAVSWTVAAALGENQGYYWRARAYDGYTYGTYSTAVSFWVNAVPEPPAAPFFALAVSSVVFETLTPPFAVTAATDPDPFDTLTYDFVVATDAGLTNVVASATGTGTAWQVTPALTALTPYYLGVRAVDSEANASPYRLASFRVDRRPAAMNLSLTPAAPHKGDALTAAYTFADADGNVDSNSLVRWYRNGLHEPAYDGALAVPATDLVRGDEWTFAVTPGDGLLYGATEYAPAVTVQDTAPVVTAPSVSPAVATRAVSLTCVTGDWSDADGDAAAYAFAWFVNGVQAASVSAALSPAGFVRGDAVTCRTTPFDGTLYGMAVTSTAVVIGNALPAAGSVAVSPALPDGSTNLTAGFTYTDADGDIAAPARIRWYRNGAPVAAYDDSATVPVSALAQVGVWFFDVTPFDGFAYGDTVTAAAVIIDGAPTAAMLSLTPAAPRTTDDLLADYVYSDPENDAEAGSVIQWFRNGVHAGAYDGLRTLPASATAHGETWRFTVRPRDGLVFGLAVTSAAVTIANSPPVITGTFPPAATEETQYIFAFAVTDDDQDTIAFAPITAPAALTVSAAGVVTWTPVFADAGAHAVTIRISDGAVTLYRSGTITVAYKDADQDGLPDTWEAQHGLSGANAGDANGDADGDGLTNAQEWQLGLDPQVSNLPPAPSLNAPPDGSRIATLPPVVSVNNASDPGGLALVYEFEVYRDPALLELAAKITGAAAGPVTTAYAVTAAVTENAAYFWRARARNALVAGPWMNAKSFRINTVNEAPAAASPVYPAGGTVTTLTPLLQATAGSDPDGDPLTYRFDVCAAADCGVVTFSASDTQPAVSVTQALADDTVYFWRVTTTDPAGLAATSATVAFRVNLGNDSPSAPVLTNYADGGTVTTFFPALTLTSFDLDGDALLYDAEADTEPTFSSSAFLSVTGGTSPVSVGPLTENAWYWIRARAFDGLSFSPWSTWHLFVDTVNDAPGTPVPNNPADGTILSVRRPVFDAYAAADPEGLPVTYDFEVHQDAALTNRFAFAAGVTAAGSLVSWTPDVDLPVGVDLWWRVRSVDQLGLAGAWSAALRVATRRTNTLPTAPTPRAPIGGVTVESLTPVLRVAASTDADGDPLTYRFEVYDDGKLATLVSSKQGIKAGGGEAEFAPAEALEPNHAYYWRAAAHDGTARGAFSDTQRFRTPALEPDEEPPSAEKPIPVDPSSKPSGGCASAGGGAPVLLWLMATWWLGRRRLRHGK